MYLRRWLVPVLLASITTACAATFNAGAALVNGVKIPTEDLERSVSASSAQTGQPAPEGEALLAQQRQQLAQLILDELLRQEAADREISIGPDEIERRLDEIKAQFPSEEEFIARIQQAGFTEESLRDQIELRAAADAIRAELAPDVSDADLKAVYETSKDQFAQAKIRHILYAIPPGEDGASQERRARASLVRLQAGASFAALARDSDDTQSAQDGGRLPGWTLLSALDPGFAGGVQEATIGEVTEPVRSQQFGWHLILVDARRVQPFRAVRDQLREQLSDQGADSAFQGFLVELASSADVEVNPRYGDWDPQAATIVPHQFFKPAEPDVEPVPNPGFELQPTG